jgi:hypothetical protein
LATPGVWKVSTLKSALVEFVSAPFGRLAPLLPLAGAAAAMPSTKSVGEP